MSKRTAGTMVATMLLSCFVSSRQAASQHLERVISTQEFLPVFISANDSINRFYIGGIAPLGGASLAVLDGNEGSLRFVDLQAAEVEGVSVDRGRGYVYVLTQPGPELRRIDALRDEVETLPFSAFLNLPPGFPPLPRFVDLNEETNTLYVASVGGLNKLAVYEIATETESEVDLADFNPLGIAVNSKTNKVFVAAETFDLLSGILGVVDGADYSVSTISFGDQFFSNWAIAVNEETNTIYLGGFGTVGGQSGRAVAIVNGSDYSFRVLLVDDFEAIAMTTNPLKNQAVAVGRTQGGTKLLTIDSDDSVKTVPLGEFDVSSVAVDRYSDRIYVTGFSPQDGPQILVFAPAGCSSQARSVAELRAAVQSLNTSADTIAVLTDGLDRVQRALDHDKPDTARERLARFEVDTVQFSNLSSGDPNAVPLTEGNDLVCAASSVIGAIELP